MLDWVSNNIHTILVITTPLIGALIAWAVRTHFRLKDIVKSFTVFKNQTYKDEIKIIHEDIIKNHDFIEDKIKEMDIKMETHIEGIRADMKSIKLEQDVVSNQIREDLKGVQTNIRDLTLSVTKLLGYLEGKEIIKSKGIK